MNVGRSLARNKKQVARPTCESPSKCLSGSSASVRVLFARVYSHSVIVISCQCAYTVRSGLNRSRTGGSMWGVYMSSSTTGSVMSVSSIMPQQYLLFTCFCQQFIVEINVQQYVCAGKHMYMYSGRSQYSVLSCCLAM